MMLGDLIIAACIGIAVGVLFGVPWGVAICHNIIEEMDLENEKERENNGR